MEIRRLSEIKEANNWFGLSKDKRISIKKLFDTEIVFFESIDITIKGENKIAVKFAYPENLEEPLYFITRSDVIRDRLQNDAEHMPFLATVKRIKNYTAYE